MTEQNMPSQALVFRPMEMNDISAVHAIERKAFSTPWSQQAFYQELTNNQVAQYIVVECGGELVGYAGVWVMIDEAHITNIAVHENFRGRKVGERLLQQLMALARFLGALRMTLEVRKSNEVAQRLYRKYGFRAVGVRKQYYSDKEDAIIMWADLPDELLEDWANEDGNGGQWK